jgi:hypothetical protein
MMNQKEMESTKVKEKDWTVVQYETNLVVFMLWLLMIADTF